MTMTAGTRIGIYEITGQLGTGGMGEVYRAKDSKLKRDVALKVLPADVAGDRERLARFQREAEVLASLNHPNIAHIHGLEEAAGVTALVMELVEGEDLSQRIARGAIPIDEALPIAKQIADALEAAHEQGIIHRDLKPANIKIRGDGTVKVLDFGLAKALDQGSWIGDQGSGQLANSPTITSPAMTMHGVILGTAAYMSPEQAKGKPVDKRADIWAFGCVLVEMLSGTRAFKGNDVTDIITSVMRDTPDWNALPAGTPSSIRSLLRRCLEKDRKRRLDSIADARLDLEDALTAPLEIACSESRSTAGTWLPWAIAVLMGLVVVATIVMWAPWLPPVLPAATRLDIVTHRTDTPALFALSPDGRHIAYIAREEGTSRLWVRSLDSTTARQLPGTEGAGAPFWSPDSRAIGFIAFNAASNALKRVDLDGGTAQTLAPAAVSRGGAWFADDVIIYAPSGTGPMMRVAATGGSPEVVPMADSRQQSNRWPHVLPDGRRFLFYATGPPETAGIYLGTIDGATATRLTPADSSGVYLNQGPGWLLWVRAGAVVAQQLDLKSAALTGEPVTVADDVLVEGNYNFSAVSVSRTGAVAYRAGATKRTQLKWFDRTGVERGTLGNPDCCIRHPIVSPDGGRVIVSRIENGNADLWLLDGARMTRLTFDTGSDAYPVWSPDGRSVAFRSNRSGPGDMYRKLASGVSPEEPIATSNETRTPLDWSSDGRFLLHSSVGPQFNYDVFVTPLFGPVRTPLLLVSTPFRENWGAFSPNAQWVAYSSDQSGRFEVYVRPFPALGAAGNLASVDAQWQISTTGGAYPVWRRDGKELYYLTFAGDLMAVSVAVVDGTFRPGVPVKLFTTRVASGADVGLGRMYDIAADGRFLINTELDEAIEPIRLLSNWRPSKDDQ